MIHEFPFFFENEGKESKAWKDLIGHTLRKIKIFPVITRFNSKTLLILKGGGGERR